MTQKTLRILVGAGVSSAIAMTLIAGPGSTAPIRVIPFDLSAPGLLHEAQQRGTPDEADDDDDNVSPPPPSRRRPNLILPPDAPLTEPATLIILKRIEDSRDMCERVPRSYIIDCLNKQLGALADELPSSGDLAPAKAVLEKASDDLNRIVRSNRDRGEPRIRAEIPGVIRTPEPLVAVRPDRAVAAEAAAEVVIAEEATVLLRSAASGGDVAASYERIAAAVDSTKVLLRSS